nr:YbaN family protein [Tissierella sp.]
MNSSFLNTIYIVLGFLFLGLGFLGVALPILPTTPFLLLASYFFDKGSPKFHNWFRSTKIYKNHLEEFIQTRSMTLKKKLFITVPVSAMLFFTAYRMDKTYTKVIIISLVAFIYYYFSFQIKTIKEN